MNDWDEAFALIGAVLLSVTLLLILLTWLESTLLGEASAGSRHDAQGSTDGRSDPMPAGRGIRDQTADSTRSHEVPEPYRAFEPSYRRRYDP